VSTAAADGLVFYTWRRDVDEQEVTDMTGRR
jgi:hypothetical protein